MNALYAGLVGLTAVVLACAVPAAVRAGGEADDHEHDELEAGPSYHGFVKDTRGVLIADAKVTADIKNRGTLVTYSNVLGAYRIKNFGIEIKPDDVTIGCSKEGYRQVRVLRRHEAVDGKAAIEIECTLQRL